MKGLISMLVPDLSEPQIEAVVEFDSEISLAQHFTHPLKAIGLIIGLPAGVTT